MTADALSFHERTTSCRGAAVPVPETTSLTAVPEAELVNEIVPDAPPLACGVKFTLNGTLFPAATVIGNEIPLRLNSALLRVADFTVTLVPFALRVAGVDSVAPTTTFPKFKVAGVTLNWPAEAPVPERGTVTELPEEPRVKDSVPLALPVDAGAKITLKV